MEQMDAKLLYADHFVRTPWQKGAIENINKRIRRFMPGNTNMAGVDQSQLTALAHHLNSTPRKCLGFKTPAEVFTTLCRKQDNHIPCSQA